MWHQSVSTSCAKFYIQVVTMEDKMKNHLDEIKELKKKLEDEKVGNDIFVLLLVCSAWDCPNLEHQIMPKLVQNQPYLLQLLRTGFYKVSYLTFVKVS